MNSKVAIIDNEVNINYLTMFNNKYIKRISTYEVINNKIERVFNNFEEISHATICCNIFLDNIKYPCELVCIKVLDNVTNDAGLTALLIALEWCNNNNIQLINLSIGSTNLYDAFALYESVNRLAENCTMVVAASSNTNKLTFPASFENVIGVKALNIADKTSVIFDETSIDGIYFMCGVVNKIIRYKNKTCFVSVSNSYAAPCITAEIFSCLNEGINNLQDIKSKMRLNPNIRKKAIDTNLDYCLKENKTIPIIGYIRCENEYRDCKYEISSYKFVSKILKYYNEKEYLGVFVSEFIIGNDYNNQILNINLNPNVSRLEYINKLNFISNYIICDFIIAEMNLDILKNIFSENNSMIDLILCDHSALKDILLFNYNVPVIDFNLPECDVLKLIEEIDFFLCDDCNGV